MTDFLKKHWTWISGLGMAVWMYVSPSLTAYLTQAETKHPRYEELIVSALLVIAHFSPSPMGSKTTPTTKAGETIL